MLVQGLEQIQVTATSIAKEVNAKVSKSDPSTLGIIFAASLCAVLPLDISQLTFAIIGAVFYALLQKQDRAAPKKKPSPAPHAVSPVRTQPRYTKPKPAPTCQVAVGSNKPAAQVVKPVAPEVRKPSVQPIAAPTFSSQGWEGEVQELLSHIAPTAESRKIISQLAETMKQTLQATIPEIEVTGFASGNLTAGKAFGVAVPEVDIIANVSPRVLFSRLHNRGSQDGLTFEALDQKKLQKSALRVCTDRLVAVGFKFRRSAFKGQEPRVTLLAPASLGLFAESIPVDFSVNIVTPLYNAALLTESGKMDARARDLILLVRRWAKDRGICHTPKGHLSPYMWGLLTIYFLQVRQDGEGPVLPPLEFFEMTSGLAARLSNSEAPKPKSRWAPNQKSEQQKSVGALFKEFVSFYQTEFDWLNESISIRLGQRAPPCLGLPSHVIVNGSASQVGPSIEDPFQKSQNLGDCMNAVSYARLKEELSRAQDLCATSASLSELLQPWAPPVPESSELRHEDDFTA